MNHKHSPIREAIGDFYCGCLCCAAHQWDYIAAHVQLTQDRWSKFTSNQCRRWFEGEGSPASPTGPPRLHCHWCMAQIDMFDQVTPWECIHLESGMFAREFLQHPSVCCNTGGPALRNLSFQISVIHYACDMPLVKTGRGRARGS